MNNTALNANINTHTDTQVVHADRPVPLHWYHNHASPWINLLLSKQFN